MTLTPVFLKQYDLKLFVIHGFGFFYTLVKQFSNQQCNHKGNNRQNKPGGNYLKEEFGRVELVIEYCRTADGKYRGLAGGLRNCKIVGDKEGKANRKQTMVKISGVSISGGISSLPIVTPTCFPATIAPKRTKRPNTPGIASL
jgi:hypothetical protein